MEQAIIEESMNDDELSIARECDALDQSEYSPNQQLYPFNQTQYHKEKKHVLPL